MADTFGFTKLVVDDLEGMSAFYQAAYGLREFDRVIAEIAGNPIDEIMLGIDRAYGPGSLVLLKFTQQPAPAPGAVILGFQTDDLDALVTRVHDLGGQVPVPPKVSEVAPVRVAFVTDLEGNLAECVQLLAS